VVKNRFWSWLHHPDSSLAWTMRAAAWFVAFAAILAVVWVLLNLVA
jgi:hypothetical protein